MRISASEQFIEARWTSGPERFRKSDYSKFYGQATKSMRVDALAQVGDEGRGQLR